MKRLVLAALLGATLVAGCGGDSRAGDPVSQVPESGGLRDKVTAAQNVKVSDFPSAKGKTLQQMAEEVKGAGATEVGLASSIFTVGKDRLAFGMIDKQGQFLYGPTAVYVAPNPGAPPVGRLLGPAAVPLTEGRSRSRQSAEETDPFAAVYEAQVNFK